MNNNWRPNWKNEEEYPDLEKTSMVQWAWEFLRRNKSYLEDYDKLNLELNQIGWVAIALSQKRSDSEEETNEQGERLIDLSLIDTT